MYQERQNRAVQHTRAAPTRALFAATLLNARRGGTAIVSLPVLSLVSVLELLLSSCSDAETSKLKETSSCRILIFLVAVPVPSSASSSLNIFSASSNSRCCCWRCRTSSWVSLAESFASKFESDVTRRRSGGFLRAAWAGVLASASLALGVAVERDVGNPVHRAEECHLPFFLRRGPPRRPSLRFNSFFGTFTFFRVASCKEEVVVFSTSFRPLNSGMTRSRTLIFTVCCRGPSSRMSLDNRSSFSTYETAYYQIIVLVT